MEQISEQKNIEKIEARLKRAAPLSLSEEEKHSLWFAVRREHRSHLAPRTSHLFMYGFSWMRMPALRFATAALALFVALGAGTAAANAAVPGDILYPVDRAVETARIALARETSRDDLRLAYAKERVAEVEKIIRQETAAHAKNPAAVQNAASSSDGRIAARIEGDEIIIDVNADGEQATISTTISGREDLIDTIVNALGMGRARVEQLLVIESASTTATSTEDTDGGVEFNVPRVREGLAVAVEFLREVSDELGEQNNEEGEAAFAEVIETLNAELAGLPQDVVLEALTPGETAATSSPVSLLDTDTVIPATAPAPGPIRVEIREGEVTIVHPVAPVATTSAEVLGASADEEDEDEEDAPRLTSGISVVIDDGVAQASLRVGTRRIKARFSYAGVEQLAADIADKYDLPLADVIAALEIRVR